MERFICALCGKERRETSLVCPRCYELYKKEAPKLLAQGKPFQLVNWVEERARKRLAEFQSLEEALKVKQGEYKALQEEVHQEAGKILRERLAGQRIKGDMRDIVAKARQEIERELWNEKRGNQLYAELKQLEEEVAEKTTTLRETLQRLEEIKGKRATEASVDRLIESALSPKEEPSSQD